MFSNDSITLQKAKKEYAVVTKKRKSAKVKFLVKTIGSLLQVTTVKQGTSELHEFLTKDDLIALFDLIEHDFPRKTISFFPHQIWHHKTWDLWNEVFELKGYKEIEKFQNMLLNKISGKNSKTQFIKIKGEKFKKVLSDGEKKKEAMREIEEKYPTLEYNESNFDLSNHFIRYYINGKNGTIKIDYDALLETYFLVTDDNTKHTNSDIKKLITLFFEKEYRSNRIKTIYNAPKYHFNQVITNANLRDKIYVILNQILSPNEIEELAAKNKETSGVNVIGRIKVINIGNYYVILNGNKQKLFKPEEKTKAKLFFEECMKEEAKEYGKKLKINH